ncbi:early nodulin-like protein 2 [Brachypodium distachyon]|uniref:Phytocyanin domain-containing protein n=1 Tax=Brachypodium distachyon TaxID=15368 RepID=A0A0Q3IS37_BRADI|nr:early nodulin-like protein 2 [Brachypodium distachyon]KQK03204.1 hypothetical protein BRADI_2g06290v3 [Brachypodium distachyon]|eukprot:XP_003565470.1 early nodulin-like protein 2 [Brachypodium distachyon]
MAGGKMAVAQLVVVALMLAATGCWAGRDFYVGDGGGWRTNPAEPFNHWAERNRFQVNDRVVFRYKGHEDSVLVVSKSHYESCNTSEPFLRLDGGDSAFVLSSSGPYFFISGHADRCWAGERLIVVVLAVRAGAKTTPPPKSSSPPAPAKASPPSPNSTQSPPSSPPAPAKPSSPPPAPAPAPPAAVNTSSSPSPGVAVAPGKNATAPPPSPSSASALSSSVLMCLAGAAAVLLV